MSKEWKSVRDMTPEEYNKKMVIQYRHSSKRRGDKSDVSQFSVTDWLTVLDEFDNRCAYCGTEGTQQYRLTPEHILPIKEGGTLSRHNIVPACVGCNKSKGTKDYKQFLSILGAPPEVRLHILAWSKPYMEAIGKQEQHQRDVQLQELDVKQDGHDWSEEEIDEALEYLVPKCEPHYVPRKIDWEQVKAQRQSLSGVNQLGNSLFEAELSGSYEAFGF